MAGQTTQVTMKINADTSAAQKQMTDLMRTLQKIQKTNFDSAFNNLGFDKAAKSAEVLANNIAKATNADTGKLDLTTLSANLRQSGTSAGELATNLLSAGAMGQQAFRQLSTAIASSEVPLKKMNATLANMATTLKNTVKWELSSTAVHGLESALSGAVSYVKNLNSSLNDIRIVTGQSVEDMARFAQQANIAAKALSTTTKAYSDASLIYYQQGDSAEQAAKKAAITIKAANASFGTSAQEMSEYLTAVWNSYKVGADELERYVDIMAALGAKTATSLEEIATSMQKVAATANTVGVSMEQVSSIIATVSSVTRESAESIGTSYKTIFARMGDLKLGKTDDGVGLGQVSSQLKSIGVNVLDATGNLREMGDIITDLGNKWQTMSAAQKTATAQVVAGKRQYTQLMALFENWDMYNQNLDISINADGSLQKMADTYAESWEAASNRLKASFEGLYSKLLNDEALIKFTNGITSVVDAVGKLVDAFGGLPGILGNIGMIASKVFSTQIGSAAGKAAEKVSNAWSQKGVIAENLFHPIKRARGETQEYKSVEQQKYARDLEATKKSYQTAIDQNPATFKVGSAARAELDNSIAVIEAKQQLLAIEGRLGPAAAQAAQEAINGMQNELNMVQQLTQEYEDMQKAQKNKDKTDAAQLLVGETDVMPTGKKGKKKISTIGTASQSRQILDTRAQNAGFTGGWTEATAAWRENATQRSLVGRASSVIGQLDTNKFDRGNAGSQDARANAAAVLKRERAALQASGVDSAAMQKADAAYDAFIKGLESDSVNDFENELKELQQALQAVQQELQQTADIMEHDLTQGAGTASKRIKQTLGDMEKEADESAEKIRQRAEAQVRANEAKGKIPTGKDKPKKKKMKDMTPEEKSDYIGKKAASAANAVSALTASLSSASNLVDVLNDESATLGDKVGSVMGTVSNIATGFATGGIAGGVAAIAGSLIGAATAWIEAKKQEELARKQAARDSATEKVNKNTEELQNQNNLMVSFTSLLNAKKEGQAVDEELKTAALELAKAYNVTGAAVANLTGNYDSFINTIQAAANSTKLMEQTQKNYDAAVDASEKASAIENKEAVYVNKSEKDSVALAESLGYSKNVGGDNRVWVRDLAKKFSTKLNGDYTVEDLLNEDALKLEDGSSFKELFMDGANLLISAEDDIEYKDMVYTRLEKMQEIMKEKGAEGSDMYKEVQQLMSEMQSEIEVYRQAKQNLENTQIQAIASSYINLSEDYNSTDYFKAWEQNAAEVRRILKEQNPTLEGEELETQVIATMQQITGTNSGLATFDMAMAAALELYNNNVSKVVKALSFIESQMGSLEYANQSVLMAYKSGGDWRQAYAAAEASAKSGVAFNAAESISNLEMTENMTMDEMGNFYDTYTQMAKTIEEELQIGTMSFEDLMALSFEDRTAYLEHLSTMLSKEAKTLTEEALEEQKALAQSYKEILEDTRGIDEARINGNRLTQEEWEEFIEGNTNNQNEFLEFVNEYYKINEKGQMVLKDEYAMGGANRGSYSRAYGQLNSDLQKLLIEAQEYQYTDEKTFSDFANEKVFNKSYLRGLGIYSSDEAILEAKKKYEDLVAAYEAANGEIDNLTRTQLLFEALESSVDSVTGAIERLTNAIQQLPTSTKDLEKIAQALNVDMDTLINSTSIDRARWVLSSSVAPTQAEYTGYSNGTEFITSEQWDELPQDKQASYEQTVDYGAFLKAKQAYEKQQSEAFSALTNTQAYQDAAAGVSTLTSAYYEFIKTGELSVEAALAFRKNGIDPAMIKNANDYSAALALIFDNLQKNTKQAELLYEQQHGTYDANTSWTAEEKSTAKYQAWAQVTQMYSELDSMQASMDNVQKQWEDSQLNIAKSQAQKTQEELDTIKSAAENGINLLNTYISDIDGFSFENIDSLKYALEDAGIAAERVKQIIDSITDSDATDEEKIKAAMVASADLALAKIGAVESQAIQYRNMTADSDAPWADVETSQILEWYYKKAEGQEAPEDVPWAGMDAETALLWHYSYNNAAAGQTIPFEEWRNAAAGEALQWYYEKDTGKTGDMYADPDVAALGGPVGWFYQHAVAEGVTEDDPKANLTAIPLTWYYKEGPAPDGEESNAPPTWSSGSAGEKTLDWKYNNTTTASNTPPELWEGNPLKTFVWQFMAMNPTVAKPPAQANSWAAELYRNMYYKYAPVPGTESSAPDDATSWSSDIGTRSYDYEYGLADGATETGAPFTAETWDVDMGTREYTYTYVEDPVNNPWAALNSGPNGTSTAELKYKYMEVGANGEAVGEGQSNAPSVVSTQSFNLNYTYNNSGDVKDPANLLDLATQKYAEGNTVGKLYYEYVMQGGTQTFELFSASLQGLYNEYKRTQEAAGLEALDMDTWMEQSGDAIINTIQWTYEYMGTDINEPIQFNQRSITIFYKYALEDGETIPPGLLDSNDNNANDLDESSESGSPLLDSELDFLDDLRSVARLQSTLNDSANWTSTEWANALQSAGLIPQGLDWQLVKRALDGQGTEAELEAVNAAIARWTAQQETKIEEKRNALDWSQTSLDELYGTDNYDATPYQDQLGRYYNTAIDLIPQETDVETVEIVEPARLVMRGSEASVLAKDALMAADMTEVSAINTQYAHAREWTRDRAGYIESIDFDFTEDNTREDYVRTFLTGEYSNGNDLKAQDLAEAGFNVRGQLFTEDSVLNNTLFGEDGLDLLLTAGDEAFDTIDEIYADLWDNQNNAALFDFMDASTKAITQDLMLMITEAVEFFNFDDPELHEIGLNLILGIGQGILDAGGDLHAFIAGSGLDSDIYQAFAELFDIHSPSRLTAKLGPYLIQGLEVGIANAAKSIDFTDSLSGLDSKIFHAFKNALDAGLLKAKDYFDEGIVGFDGEIVATATTSGDFSATEYIDSYMTKYTTDIHAAEEELEGQVFASAEAAMAAAAAAGFTEDEGFTADKITVTSRQRMVTRQREIPNMVYNDDTQTMVANTPTIVTEEVPVTEYVVTIDDKAVEDNITNQTNEMYAQVMDGFSAQWLNGGYKTDNSMSPVMKKLLEQGLADVTMNGEIAITDDNSAEILSQLEKYFGTELDVLVRQVDQAWTSIKTNWQNGLEQLYENELEKAQEVYELWTKTFEAIATARSAILAEENIVDAMSGSHDSLAYLIQKWLKDGKNPNEIYSLLYGGATEADVQFDPWDINEHRLTGNYQYLNYSEAGYERTTVASYNSNVHDTIWGEGPDSMKNLLAGLANETITEDWLNDKATGGSAAERALLAYLVSEGMATIDPKTGMYKVASTMPEKFSALVSDDILNKMYDKMKVDTQDEVDAIFADAYATQILERQAQVDKLITETTTERDNIVKDRELVQKAMRGEELTEDEQIELDKILLPGETLAEANGRLAAAADDAAKALWQISQAIGDGYFLNKNGEWVRGTGRTVQIGGAYHSEEEARNAMLELGYTEAQLDGLEFRNTAQNGMPTNIPTWMVYGAEIEKLGGTGNLNDGYDPNDAEEGEIKLLDTATNAMAEYATMLGMTQDELKEYISLLEGMDEGQDFDLTTAAGVRHAGEVARITKEAGEGLDTLRTDWSKTFGILKGETKVSTKEMASTMSSFRKNMGKIFNVKPELFDDKFIEENLDNFDKLMNGTEEEAAEAGKAIEKALLDKLLTTEGKNQIVIDVDSDGFQDELAVAQSAFDAFLAANANAEVGTTVNVDTSTAIQGLNSLLSAGIMTADGITAALNAIGWEPEITYDEYPVDAVNKVAGGAWFPNSNGTGKVYIPASGYIEQDGVIRVPRIGSVTKTGSGASAPSLNPSSGSGGGGGDQKPKKEKLIKFEDEVDRYHEVNQRLERMGELLEKIDKYKSRAFGKGYLKNLEQESKMLKAQQAMYKRKMDEAKMYYEQDSANMANKYGATFDEYGNMSNYDEVLAGIIADENRKIEYYNSLSAAEQKKLDEQYEHDGGYIAYIAKTREDFKEDLADMEESIATMAEAENNWEEIINQLSALKLEEITYKAEYQMELNDADRKLLQFYVDRYEDDVNKQAESFEKLVAQGAELVADTELLKQKQEELNAAYAAGEITEADYAEGLKATRDALLENAEALLALEKNVKEFYGNTLEMINDAFQEQVDHITAASDAMQSYINILGLMGKGQNYNEKALFYGQRADFAQQEAIAKKAHLDLLLGQKADFDAIIASGRELTEAEKQWYEDLLNAIDDANVEFLDSVDTALTYLQEKYENAANKISEDLDKALAGAFGSLEHLSDAYSYYTETQDRYVSSARELYEVSKLNRDIEMSIEDATTSASKKMLKDLKDRINAQSELNKLTEYDIEMNRLQYELALAKIGLEEAQNAKDTVRLTRDESGNYIYQYTADNDKINEAQQTYEDVLQQINDLALNRVQELEQGFIETRQAYKEQYDAIINDMNLTDEERAAKLAELNERFKADMDYYAEQMGIATENLTISNSTIMQVYADDLRTVSMTTRDGINEDIAKLIENKDQAIESFRQAVTDATTLSSEHQKAIDAFTSQTVGDYTAMSNAAIKYGDDVDRAMGKAEDAVGESTDAMLDAIRDLGANWESFIDGPLDAFIDGIIELAEEIQDTLYWLSELETETATTPEPGPEPPANIDPTPQEPEDDDNTTGNQTNNTGGSGSKTKYVVSFPGKSNATFYSQSDASRKLDAWRDEWKAAEIKKAQDYAYATWPGNGSMISGYMGTASAGIAQQANSMGSISKQYKTGGLADFTGPAWLDGTKSQPELVLNSTDTQNMLRTVHSLRELDTDSITMLLSALGAATASLFGALNGNYHASGVTTSNMQELNQNVEIHADFPNVTDKNEIIEAIDDLVNRASQFAQKKMW